MDPVDELLAGNRRYRETYFTKALAERPANSRRQLAVVACMDARMIPERILGLQPGDANVIRSAGASVDDGVLRSLVAAVHLLGVRTIILMPHTDCGMQKLAKDPDLLAQPLGGLLDGDLEPGELKKTVEWLEPIGELDAHVQESMGRIRDHPLLPKDLTIQGLIYDLETGAVTPLPAES